MVLCKIVCNKCRRSLRALCRENDEAALATERAFMQGDAVNQHRDTGCSGTPVYTEVPTTETKN